MGQQMIENKEEYKAHCKELIDRQLAAMDVLETVKKLIEQFGDIKLSEAKTKLYQAASDAIREHEEYTREEYTIMGEINNKYSISQILWWTTNGYDTVDMVNAYLRGDLERLPERD